MCAAVRNMIFLLFISQPSLLPFSLLFLQRGSHAETETARGKFPLFPRSEKVSIHTHTHTGFTLGSEIQHLQHNVQYITYLLILEPPHSLFRLLPQPEADNFALLKEKCSFHSVRVLAPFSQFNLNN